MAVDDKNKRPHSPHTNSHVGWKMDRSSRGSTRIQKENRAFSATLFFFDVSRAFFSTRYLQLVFTVLTVELRVVVEKKALLTTRNSYRKEGLNLEEP